MHTGPNLKVILNSTKTPFALLFDTPEMRPSHSALSFTNTAHVCGDAEWVILKSVRMMPRTVLHTKK